MLDWLAAIQFSDGGIQGGKIDATVKVPVTFNTGQVLLGFCAGARAFGDYHENLHAAARFLRDSLDADGCWRRHPTPFAVAGEKAYERSEEHTSELQSLMRISYAVFCLKKKK